MNSAGMKITEKIEFARWARECVTPYVRAHGQHHPAGVDGPRRWQLETTELMVYYTEQALLDPADRSLSCMLDVWASGRAKVLSLTWETDRPWQPPQIVRHVSGGPWRQALDRLVST